MKAIKDAIGAFRSGEGLKGQLLRGGVGSVAVKIGSTLLNVILAVVLARALGAEGFGVYSFVFALITILAIPAQMGLPNLVVRETAQAQGQADAGGNSPGQCGQVRDPGQDRACVRPSEEPVRAVHPHHRHCPGRAKLTLTNLAYNFDRLVFHKKRAINA
jgi:hypothetical protein